MANETDDELLVIIGPQKDFIHPNGAYAKKNYGLQQVLQAKSNLAKLLKGHKPAVIVTSDYRQDQFAEGLSIGIPGTFGHEMDIPFDEDITVIIKTAHSAFTSKSFTDHLKEQGYQKLLLTGFLAEYCVKATAADALTEGFEVVLLSDCIGTGDLKQPIKTQILEGLKLQGARVR